jgi:hypothetical protein
VINETIDPEATPAKIMKALPAHSPPPAKASSAKTASAAGSTSTPAPAKKSHPSPTPADVRKAVPLEPFNKKEKRNGE